MDPTQLVLVLNLPAQVTSNIRKTKKWFRSECIIYCLFSAAHFSRREAGAEPTRNVSRHGLGDQRTDSRIYFPMPRENIC